MRARSFDSTVLLRISAAHSLNKFPINNLVKTFYIDKYCYLIKLKFTLNQNLQHKYTNDQIKYINYDHLNNKTYHF